MLERADRPIEEVMRALAAHGVEAGFLVPTETGLAKSIMDAHRELRDFLQRVGLHDYERQAKGPAAKLIVPAKYVGPRTVEDASASLYRPETKDGDPRIWITGLARRAEAGNLLALLVHEGTLYVANTSVPGVLESLDTPTSPLGRVVAEIERAKGGAARELLGKLGEVAGRGYVRSLRPGPTGVGMTLETLLGIEANSSKSPDFKGIEIKASRTRSGRRATTSRVTLFSKVPDWKSSPVKSAVELLRAHGYDRAGRRQLYCSMNHQPNTLGLFLAADEDNLHVMTSRTEPHSKVLKWDMSGLRQAFAEKHRETFWVKASVKKSTDGVEHFHYTSVVHTRAPVVSDLESLFDRGHVELDFLLHLRDRGPGQRPRARDHGYLFKMHPRDLSLVFPPPVIYDLEDGP